MMMPIWFHLLEVACAYLMFILDFMYNIHAHVSPSWYEDKMRDTGLSSMVDNCFDGYIGGIIITLGFLENFWWRLFENGYIEMLLYWATLSFSQAWCEEKWFICCCAALNYRNLYHRHEFTFPFVGLRALEKCRAENTDIFSPVTT